MDITKLSETRILRFSLTNAPSTQMYSGPGNYTLDAEIVAVQIEDNKLDNVTLSMSNSHWHDAGRTYLADDVRMPGWLRQFLRDVLPEGTHWPMADEAHAEFVVHRPATPDLPEFTLAIVGFAEVWQFLKGQTWRFKPEDYTVSYDGGEPVNGMTWMRKHKLVSK